jgi:hypothetical protein
MDQGIKNGNRVLSTLKADIGTLMTDTVGFLNRKYKQAKSIFTAASPFGQILTVLNNLSQLVFYYVEDATTEQNIYEATRASSVYSLASLAGHNPSRAVSATGELQISVRPGITDIPSNKVICHNYMKLRCVTNGLPYVMELPQEEVKFSLTGIDNNFRFVVRQGEIETQTFTATGAKFESFQLGFPNNFFIDNFLVNVYVNGEQWVKYDSLKDIPRKGKGYFIRTGVTNGLDIFFGNNTFGQTLPPGATVTVEYLVTEGAAGIIKSEDPRHVIFEFEDSAFTLLGEEVNLNDYVSINVINIPNFGSDPEPLELTRLIAPHASKSFALVNDTSYEILLRKMQLFSAIRVSLDEVDERMFNILLVPDTRKLYTNGSDYFRLGLDKFKLSDFQKNEILRYIKKCGSEVVSIDARILDPKLTKYVINVSTIIYDDVADEIVRAEIIEKIGSYFIQVSRNDRIPKSDLIRELEGIVGIDSVSVNIICEANEASKSSDPNAPEVGIDELNDIIIKTDEFPVIRGGWKDRFGNEYSQGLSDDGLGCLNIQIKNRVPRKKF